MAVVYQLKMVKTDDKGNVVQDVCTIGTFKNEQKLKQWAEECDGEIERNQ